MPLPNIAQAEALSLLKYCRHDMCGGCGTEKKAPGHLLGHECRARLGLTEQGKLVEVDPSRICDTCHTPLPANSNKDTLRHRGDCEMVHKAAYDRAYHATRAVPRLQEAMAL